MAYRKSHRTKPRLTEPRLISSDPSWEHREAFRASLPNNADWDTGDHRTASGEVIGDIFSGGTNLYNGGGGGSSLYHMQRPYMPELESPDRQHLPDDRREANRNWRTFHKFDPIFGNAIDMYCDMMFSDFDLTFEGGESGDSKSLYEDMCQEVNLHQVMKTMTKEFLVIGECVPQLIFDDEIGYWTYVGFHNPDYIEVLDSPIINMEPVVSFVPDASLRQLFAGGTSESLELRQRMPQEFVSKVMAGQKITLNPLNCSFIARKLHPYDVRGTSIATRLWRIFMVEDAAYAATIATYRRHAGPVKVVKLGDPSTGWIPGPSHEQKMIEMLKRAETDPNCFVPETLVNMADGSLRPIGVLKVGDKVLDRHGKVEEVLAWQEEVTHEIVELKFHNGVEVECTPNHKWPVWENGIEKDVFAEDLRPALHTLRTYTGEEVKIHSVYKHGKGCKVINMTVSGDHSYCVESIGSRNSWLVYNYGVSFEAWGTTDRIISALKDNESIERIKLAALGLSKSFISGEVSFACQLRDARVLMASGLYKEIEKVSVGDVVVDRFGDHKKVVDTLKYDSPDSMTEIMLFGKRKLVLTDNHKLPVFTRPRKCLCGCGYVLGDAKTSSNGCMTWSSFKVGHARWSLKKVGWKEYLDDDRVVFRYPENHSPYAELEAKDVRPGDYLMIPRKFEPSNVPVTEETLAKARLLGYYTAEGHCSDVSLQIGTKQIKFSFGMKGEAKEEFYVQDSISLAEGLGFSASVHFSEGKMTVYFPTSTSGLAWWFEENAGKYSGEKHFSKEVMGWDLKLKEELLKGMYRGDGYLSVRKSLSVVYTTVSEKLAYQLEIILAQLGYPCIINKTKSRIDKKGCKHRPVFMVSVNGVVAYSLAKMIWGDVFPVWENKDWSQYNFEKSQGSRTSTFKDDDYLYIPVKSVRSVPVDKKEDPFVHSLTVEDTHSYVTEGVASFNSAKSGLQVFLRRLLSMRQYFEAVWMYPKFFKPVAEMNGFCKAQQSSKDRKQVKTGYIKKRGGSNSDQNLIIPKVMWKNKLDPELDTEFLNAAKQLEGLGIKISKQRTCAAVGIDFKEEQARRHQEFIDDQNQTKKDLGETKAKEFMEQEGAGKAKPPGGAGAGTPPPAAKKSPGGDASHPPGSGPDQKAVPLADTPQAPGTDGLSDTID